MQWYTLSTGVRVVRVGVDAKEATYRYPLSAELPQVAGATEYTDEPVL